jgi:hypothetical protein
MNEHSMRDAYEASLRDGELTSPRQPVPLERLEALVSRDGDEAERLRTLDVLLSSADGRKELEIAWAAARATPARSAWRWNPRMSAAAALAIVSIGTFGIVRARDGAVVPAAVVPPQTTPSLRDSTVAAAPLATPAPPPRVSHEARPSHERVPETARGADAPLQLIAPRGRAIASQQVRFAWHVAQDVRVYTLVVTDAAGRDVFAITTRDTSAILPDSVQLKAGGEYLWWVQAERGDGSTISAVTERVRVRP